jgi:hypothetical protein
MIAPEERLYSCKICTKRNELSNGQTLCSITNSYPNFVRSCQHFCLDPARSDKDYEIYTSFEVNGFVRTSSDRAQIAILLITLGSVKFLVATVLLTIGLYSSGRFKIAPVFFIITGLAVIFIGISKFRNRKR